MKTAMQEIIERADASINVHTAIINSKLGSTIEKDRHSHFLSACEMFKTLANALIEKEKQQIKDALKSGNTSFVLPTDLDIMAETYYNETFKP